MKKEETKFIWQLVEVLFGFIFIAMVVALAVIGYNEKKDSKSAYNLACQQITSYIPSAMFAQYDKEFCQDYGDAYKDFGKGKLKYSQYVVTVPVTYETDEYGTVQRDIEVEVSLYHGDAEIPAYGHVHCEEKTEYLQLIRDLNMMDEDY